MRGSVARRVLRRRTLPLVKRIVVALAVVVALVVGGPWVYINLIRDEAPDALTLPAPTTVEGSSTDDSDATAGGSTTTEATSTTASAATEGGESGGVAGEWVAATGSVAGYRVEEVLFGQRVTAVGRTSSVTGEVEIDGTSVVAASFTVDLASVASDDGKRDSQFRTRIMDVLNHPTATFVLASPIALPQSALGGGEFTARATGDLTLRGTTRRVVLDLTARLADGRIEIAGSTVVVFADFGIPDPSLPGISTEDRGTLEVLLVMERP